MLEHNELRAQELRELADKVERGEVTELVWAVRLEVSTELGSTHSWLSQAEGGDKAWMVHLCRRLSADIQGKPRPRTPGAAMHIISCADTTGEPLARDIWEISRAEIDGAILLGKIAQFQFDHFQRMRRALEGMVEQGYRWERVLDALALRGSSIYTAGAEFRVEGHGDGYKVTWEIDQRVSWMSEGIDDLVATVLRAEIVVRGHEVTP